MIADTIENLPIEDLGPVAEIHAACFHDAWGAGMLRQVLGMPGAFGLVARWGARGSMIGFALARVVADECELLSLGVAPQHRARGVGRELLIAAMARAADADARNLFLEVAENNVAALKLYRAHGLVQIGQRPEYYETPDGRRTMALTMRCDLPGRGGAVPGR
jgi:ribosomal-protein-alanine N-acetyltransferase